MKRYLIAIAVFCALPARADEAALEAICAAAGGRHGQALRGMPPNIQLQDDKLSASCGSGR